MNTYPRPATPPALSDDCPNMPLIVRIVTGGPNLGKRTETPAWFISAAECERNADYCARLYQAGGRVALARDERSQRQSAQWIAYHTRRNEGAA